MVYTARHWQVYMTLIDGTQKGKRVLFGCLRAQEARIR